MKCCRDRTTGSFSFVDKLNPFYSVLAEDQCSPKTTSRQQISDASGEDSTHPDVCTKAFIPVNGHDKEHASEVAEEWASV
jgi:hypothetical protein